ncbi:MAG: hypothetical protein V1647_01895, partial [Pseudomonadota bacterium]
MKLLFITVFLASGGVFAYTAGVNVDRQSKFTTAEAAYLNGDLFKAEYFFKDVIKGKIQDAVTFNAMDRLVSIAETTDDKKLFADVLLELKDVKNSSEQAYQSLLYTTAKYALHNGKCDVSIGLASKIDPTSAYYLKALYLKAGCLGVAKKYKEALLLFDNIIKAQNSSVQQELKDLAILGKGRMFMMLKRYDKALIEYESIEPTSVYYLESMEEITRVFLSKKDYEQALSHLEALAFVNKKLSVKDDYLEGDITLTDFGL